MVQVNFGLKTIHCKLVYYGPGMSGKTTNLEKVHELAPQDRKGTLTSVATEGDRTLFFDFMPLELGKVAGMDTKFQLYTVPGQVYYDATRKLVLQGADAVIFVADSDPKQKQPNIESLENLVKNLKENGIDISTIAFVIQYNKRDLPQVMSIEEMQKDLNRWNVPYHEAVAYKGEGVMGTLKTISKMMMEDLQNKYMKKAGAVPAASAPAPTPAPAPKPAATAPAPAPKPAPAPAPAPKAAPAPAPAPKPAPAPAPMQKPQPAPVAAEAEQKGGFFSKLFGMFKKK